MKYTTTEHYGRVKRLNEKINNVREPWNPTMPSDETRTLRARLIFEEALETIEALGVTIYGPDGEELIDEDFSLESDHKKPSMVEIVDGCADISVVTMGTLVACGVPDRELLELVDENNLAKFGPGGHRREDGKWVKPPNHEPPAIAAFLARLGYEGP